MMNSNYESEPHIIFRGGPNDGKLYPVNPLQPVNRIDRWDDRTIEPCLASPLIPIEQFKLVQFAGSGNGPGSPHVSSEHFYRYTGERVGDGYIYEFVRSRTNPTTEPEPQIEARYVTDWRTAMEILESPDQCPSAKPQEPAPADVLAHILSRDSSREAYGNVVGIGPDLTVHGGFDSTLHDPQPDCPNTQELTAAERIALADAMISRWQQLRARAATETLYRGKTYRDALAYLEAERPDLVKLASSGRGLAHVPEIMAAICAWDAAVFEFLRMLREVPMRDLQAMTEAMLSPPPMA